MRRRHSATLKAQVALEAIRGEVTVAEIAKKYQVHPRQVQAWKAEVLGNLALLFGKVDGDREDAEPKIAALERKVGQLTLENDFLKKRYQNSVKRSDSK
jgi:transposase-like protein